MPIEWGYLSSNGPSTWSNVAPAAKGKRQSPIDIIPGKAQFDKTLKEKPLRITYTPSKAKEVSNSGKSVMVTYDPSGPCLTGGPLAHKFQLHHFHFHWGKTSGTGSEHRVDGHVYSAEAHLVHYNTDLFANFADAVKADNGLCVLGVFLKPGAPHAGLKKVTDLLSKVRYKDTKVPIQGGFDPSCILPADTERYWTYPGSLTTPPCYESVTWIVFKEPIEVAEDQLQALRLLKSNDTTTPPSIDEFHGHIVENYRPPMPLSERTVRASFRKFFT